MKCIIFVLLVISGFLAHCLAFNCNVNRSLQFTSLEDIVKRGIHKICDRQSDNVFNKCGRPLVLVSDYDSDFDLHTEVGVSIADVLGLDVKTVNLRLCDEIKKELSTIVSCDILYDSVNIKLKDDYLLDKIDSMINDEERLDVGKISEEKVVVDYFSPNVGKMLHMGHIRSLAIGQCISNILEFVGCKVYRRNHIGDFGMHSGIIMRYLIEYDVQAMDALNSEICDKERLMQMCRSQIGYEIFDYHPKYRFKNLHLPIPLFGDKLVLSTIDSYYKMAHDKYEKDQEFSKRAKIETNLLQNSKSFGQIQWERIKDVCIGHYDDILEYFYIKGLKNIPESMYINRAKKLINQLIEEGKINQQDENLVVFNLLEDKIGNKDNDNSNSNDKDEDKEKEGAENMETPGKNNRQDGLNKSVLRTSEGSLTYMATDLAALSHRVNWNKPDRIIYVTDKDQRLHFEKLYKISQKLNLLNNCEFEHIGFGQVTLKGSGKLRSRSGNKCSLVEITKQIVDKIAEDLVNRGDYLQQSSPVLSRKIGVGSLIYSDLSVDPGSGYDFSIDRLIKQGNNNLISILYSYVRSLTLLKKAENLEKLDKREFRSPYERRLARTLIGFENMIVSALSLREPNRVTRYLFQLSKEFNRFYQHTPVIVDNIAYLLSLKLVKLTSMAIELGLKFLNIQPVKHL